MNIFKRSQKLDTNLLFEKIMKHEHNTFEKTEIDFLQTPHPENIQEFFELYKNLSSFKKSVFFDYFKDFIDGIHHKEKQLKMTLFSKSLIVMCIDNIEELIATENHTGGFGIHLFFILFDAAEKLYMKNGFKINIINRYKDFVRKSPKTSAIVKPYFDMKKEELGYEHF